MYIGVGFVLQGGNDFDLYIQHTDDLGNLLWGELVIPVNNAPYPSSTGNPHLVPDGVGGVILVFSDNRAPWDGAVFVQRYSSNGDTLWPQDVFICQSAWVTKVISDGVGGVIIQAGGMPNNCHWRVDGNGNILWLRNHLSYYDWATIVPGEPGFFYLSFTFNGIVYGQKMDINGNNYWPFTGAPMSFLPSGWLVRPILKSYNSNHCLYTTYIYVDNSDHERIYIQSLDSLGNRNFGEMGSMLNSVTDPGTYQYINTTPCEDGGCISVFDINFYDYNVWAKRCNEDGTLGGPLPPVEDVVIHISGDDIVLTWPSQGDSMQYNIFKSTEPYKFNLINPDTTISDTVFVDVNALSEEMKYYNVTFEMMNKIK